MFDDPKKKKNKKADKEREKIRKHALREQAKYDAKRREADKIKDEKYVQTRLAEEKLKDEELMRKRDSIVNKNLQDALGQEVKDFKCKACGNRVALSNLTCPVCGQLYCQYCGFMMDMLNPGQCPRCGGAPFYTPAELVITKVEDLPPEERFWEELPTCPKCGATVQKEWDQCPICNARLGGKGGVKEDTGVWEEKDLPEEGEDEQVAPKKLKRREREKAKGKRGI